MYGIPERNGEKGEEQEDCEEEVLSMFQKKTKLDIRGNDIEACHRLGKKNPEKNSPRGIIVRFISTKSRDTVLYNGRTLKRSGVVIVEDLTPGNYTFLRIFTIQNRVKNEKKDVEMGGGGGGGGGGYLYISSIIFLS